MSNLHTNIKCFTWGSKVLAQEGKVEGRGKVLSKYYDSYDHIRIT